MTEGLSLGVLINNELKDYITKRESINTSYRDSEKYTLWDFALLCCKNTLLLVENYLLSKDSVSFSSIDFYSWLEKELRKKK